MRISEYEKKYRSATFHAGENGRGASFVIWPFLARRKMSWTMRTPGRLIKNGCIGVVEGSNMPSTERAMNLLRRSLLFAPGQGGECRRGGHFRFGDEPEQSAFVVGDGGDGGAAAGHHAQHSSSVRGIWRQAGAGQAGGLIMSTAPILPALSASPRRCFRRGSSLTGIGRRCSAVCTAVERRWAIFSAR